MEGREYPAVAHMGEPVYSLSMDRADWEAFSSSAEVSRSSPDAPCLVVRVRKDAVSRRFSRRWLASWFGEEVDVVPIDPETAHITYDRDPGLAKMMGMVGDQYNGFTADVPFEELSEIRVVERDFPIVRPEAR